MDEPTDQQLWQEKSWHEWRELCGQHDLAMDTERVSLCRMLYGMLLEANASTNLTRITDLTEFLERHLLESMLIVRWIPDKARVADVGSGGGFPALPMAIARPDIHVTAIESVGKKSRFIHAAVETMQLKNMDVIQGRAEDLAVKPSYREGFDIVTARAVAPLPTLLEITIPLLKPGGKLLALKGSRYEEEVARAKNAFTLLNASVQTVEHYSPQSDGVLLIIQKKGKTSPVYPRRAGLPTKKPL